MSTKEEFLKDVVEGLTSVPKKLSSKYFYDEVGDKLFHYIMNQPEYYLTCAEHEILQTKGEDIVSRIPKSGLLRIIEPGAGDGFKTKILINKFINHGYRLVYNPIDISPNVLDILCGALVEEFPQLNCEPVAADYFHLKGKIPNDGTNKLMLFLGSNLGNFTEEVAINVLMKFEAVLQSGDFLLLGVDIVKDPNRIHAAYNDANGVTAQFNFNLLNRINKELEGDFVVDNFIHYPIYNPIMQQAESYLISQIEQDVFIKAANKPIHFGKWEPIMTEISRKYTVEKLKYMACSSGFEVLENYYDMNMDFCCSLWKKG